MKKVEFLTNFKCKVKKNQLGRKSLSYQLKIFCIINIKQFKLNSKYILNAICLRQFFFSYVKLILNVNQKRNSLNSEKPLATQYLVLLGELSNFSVFTQYIAITNTMQSPISFAHSSTLKFKLSRLHLCNPLFVK